MYTRKGTNLSAALLTLLIANPVGEAVQIGGSIQDQMMVLWPLRQKMRLLMIILHVIISAQSHYIAK